MIKDKETIVPAVDRCIRILEFIANSNIPVSAKELAEKLDIPIASSFRIIKNLVERGYLVESVRYEGKYELGLKILYLAEKKIKSLDVRTIAREYMEKLSNETGQTVQLGKLENNAVIYIEQAMSLSPVKVVGSLYTPIQLNVSASGKVLCAFLSPYKQMEIVENAEFIKLTENSQMNKEEFRKTLPQIKKQHYAIDLEEYSIGVGCIAVPIFNYKGECIAALGLTGNIEDYVDEQKNIFMKNTLMNAAKSISLKLGAQEEKNHEYWRN